jgi:hypothetical protein
MDALNELIEAAKRERYYEQAEPAIETLKADLTPPSRRGPGPLPRRHRGSAQERDRGALLLPDRSRRSRDRHGPYVKKAIEVVNGDAYAGILNGTIKP